MSAAEQANDIQNAIDALKREIASGDISPDIMNEYWVKLEEFRTTTDAEVVNYMRRCSLLLAQYQQEISSLIGFQRDIAGGAKDIIEQRDRLESLITELRNKVETEKRKARIEAAERLISQLNIAHTSCLMLNSNLQSAREILEKHEQQVQDLVSNKRAREEEEREIFGKMGSNPVTVGEEFKQAPFSKGDKKKK